MKLSDDWLTRKEAAAYLKCSERTITTITGQMKNGVLRNGKNFLRINKNDLNEFLRRR